MIYEEEREGNGLVLEVKALSDGVVRKRMVF